MNTLLDEKTKKILSELQNGFKLEARPFKRISNEVGCTEEEVIATISNCCDNGIIRRIGAAIKPQNAGYATNALTAWNVPAEKIHEVGTELAEMKEVSHCYDRECPEGWNYNLFVMIHSHSKEELDEIIKKISEKFDLKDYKVFNTVRELKKTSMRYF
jgi:DNA-binding Lrp family transcriptional regulator